MLRLLYTTLFILALPVIFLRLWWKEKKAPGYGIRWPERFGIFPSLATEQPVVWVHAVSVGEVVAATPLIRRLLDQNEVQVMVTTMTPTGSQRVRSTFKHQVYHVYAPYDLPWTVRAFLKRTRPALAVIMETELWPNVLSVCTEQRVPVLLANARLSARSARRYAYFAKTIHCTLNQLSQVAVQNQEDGERFKRLGLAPQKLAVTGSIKFDVTLPPSVSNAVPELREAYSNGGRRPVVIAASTHDGEEIAVLTAFRKVLKQHPNTLLLMVPRHPERFDEIFELCDKRFRCLRRSTLESPSPDTQIIVGDTMGEMMLLYGCADIAFVGGSLRERGGHNMIEPAYWGLPIVCGPHTFNFADISKRLTDLGGMTVVENANQLAQQLCVWLDEPDERAIVGGTAKNFVLQNRGATDRVMKLMHKYIPARSA